MIRYLVVALLALSVPAQAEGIRIWAFERDLEGWQATNWESLEARDGALEGVSKYDCQLLSPPLNIRAEDYPELVVRVRSSMSGGGELFFNHPGEPMSDVMKLTHALVGSRDYLVYRIPLSASPDWNGTIERIRFDAINPAGAHLAIDFIALLPEKGMLLINGGAEVVKGEVPFEWTGGPDARRATATTDRPFAGKRALRMSDGGWWEPVELDLSFLGEFRIAGHVRRVRGGAPALSIRFLDLDGKEVSRLDHSISPAGADWTPFEFHFDAPRRAASARVRFHVPEGESVSDLDEIAIQQMEKGYIKAPPPPAPAWDAQWIWHPDMLRRDNVHVYFRRQLDLPDKEIRLARLQITADDAYALSVNGKTLHQTFGEVDGWKTPEVLDLKPVLRAGANAIAVEAQDAVSAQGLIAEGVIVFADGEEQSLRTDGTWLAATEPNGPWKPAADLGVPPCPPWGALPYQSLGPPAKVELRLARVPEQVQAPGALPIRIEAVARSAVRRPVYVAVVLERDGKPLRREWAPGPLFAEGANPGDAGAVSDWRFPLPFGMASGPAALRIELTGGECVGAAPSLAMRVSAAETPREFPTARIEVRGGLPHLTVNGVETDPTQVLFNVPDRLQQANATSSGAPIWSIALDDMGFTQQGFDYAKIDETIAKYLEWNPNVWLLPTFSFDTRYQKWWIEAHPEARCRLEDGGDVIGDYHGARRQVPSVASEVWRRDYGEAVRRLIRHLKDSPFASRIIGYQPCSGVTWEWFHWGSQSGELVDYSEAGVADFRRWLRERYGSDEALQRAWGDPKATLAAAPVPPNARRRAPAHGVFYDPATQQDVLDYHRYQHDIVADTILYFARIIKEESGGRSLVGTYYGYVMHLPEIPGFCQSSGHFSLYRLLRSPDVDFLMAPDAYAWREVGGTGACMAAAGSFPLNGKLFWNQADLRSHWSPQEGFGRPRDLRGSVQAMRRGAAMNLALGTGIQWYDFSNGWTFGDERLSDEARRLLAVNGVRQTAVDWPLSDYLAVVVDEEQMGTFDLFHPLYGLELIYHQREKLTRSGVPWRAYLLSDVMAHPELLQHRAFLFLNLFRLTAAQRDFLRTKVMKAGRTVAFVGPVGLMDEKGFSAARSSEILGWPMVEVAQPEALRVRLGDDLPTPWRPCAKMEIGCAAAFAPIVLPDRQTGAVLGALKGGDRPAALFEARSDVKLFWSAAPGLLPEMIRAIATVAGLPIVSAGNDAIYVGYGCVGVHAPSDGKRQIRLPRPASVRELLSGKTWPAGTQEVELDLNAGDTAILHCSQ